MILKNILSLVICCSLSTCTVLFAQTYQDSSQALLDKAINEEACVGIAAGFSVDNETKWTGGQGLLDQNEQDSFTDSTLTRLASIAKPMTAIAIMQLFEKGLIELDVPLQTYLPNFPVKPEGNITVRQLLNHSSGIDAYQSRKERQNKENYENLAAAVDLFKDRDLLAVPGQTFNYTSYGYTVLGLVIEAVSGMTYEEYMQTNIWDVIGMDRTGVEYFGEEYQGKAALYHLSSKGKMKDGIETNLSDRVPGGGIYSCVNDLLKFGNAILNHTLISESTLDSMLVDVQLKQEGNGYGFGWYLYGNNPAYGFVFGHNGAQIGCTSLLLILPEQNTVTAVVSNTSGVMGRVFEITMELFHQAAAAKEE